MQRLYRGLGTLLCLGAGTTASALEFENIRFNGYYTVEYEQMLSKEGKGDKNGSFDIDLLDLVFNWQVTPRLRLATDITFEHGVNTEDNGVTVDEDGAPVLVNKGNIGLEYAFAEYTVNSAFRPRVGKYLTPFGIYNEIHTAKPAFLSVKEPSATNKVSRIAKDSVRFYPRWVAGLSFVGDVEVGSGSLDYNIVYGNGGEDGYGAEESNYEKDNGKDKSVIARVRYSPLDHLKLGVSYYKDRDFSADVKHLYSQAFQLEYEVMNIALQTEYMTAKIKPREEGGSDWTQTGAYLQLAYYIEAIKLVPFARYETYDPNTDEKKDEGTNTVIGVNWEFQPAQAFKVELDQVRGGDENKLVNKYSKKGWDEIKAAVCIAF